MRWENSGDGIASTEIEKKNGGNIFSHSRSLIWLEPDLFSIIFLYFRWWFLYFHSTERWPRLSLRGRDAIYATNKESEGLNEFRDRNENKLLLF